MTRVVSSRRTAASEAVFGSAARGDNDALSDRDVLIVDDDVAVLSSRIQALEAEGASVASYTFAQLAALSARGALFIQHLKLEANISRDRNGRLGKLLAGFVPKDDYSAEIEENTHLSKLAGLVPVGARGMLLAADILYVTVRNHGVLSLASRGIHVYAFDNVVALLERERMIAPGGARALKALRFLKCLYRNGEGGRAHAAKEAIDIALAVLPSEYFPPEICGVDPRDIIGAPVPQPGASSYLVLRDLERRLVALQMLGREHLLKGDGLKLAAWIANPRAYAMTSCRNAPRLQSAIARAARIDADEILIAAQR